MRPMLAFYDAVGVINYIRLEDMLDGADRTQQELRPYLSERECNLWKPRYASNAGVLRYREHDCRQYRVP